MYTRLCSEKFIFYFYHWSFVFKKIYFKWIWWFFFRSRLVFLQQQNGLNFSLIIFIRAHKSLLLKTGLCLLRLWLSWLSDFLRKIKITRPHFKILNKYQNIISIIWLHFYDKWHPIKMIWENFKFINLDLISTQISEIMQLFNLI